MAITVGTNTYVTVADANAYFKYGIHAAAWTAASNGDKESALVTATRTLDRQKWLGEKYQDAPTQVLDFPRSGLVDNEGDAVDETTVPQEVIDATCEYALGLLNNASLQDERSSGSNIKRLKAGSAEIEFIRAEAGPRFETIVNELIGLWLSGSSVYSGPFVSGSDFEDPSGTFGLTRGY